MANVPLRPLGAKFYGAFWKAVGTNITEFCDIYVNFNIANFSPTLLSLKAIGANFVVLTGVPYFTLASPISQAAYIANRMAVIDYCADIGMHVLLFGMFGYGNWNGATGVQMAALMAVEAAEAAKRPNCMGYVTMDEPRLGTPPGAETVLGNATLQYNSCKAVVPSDFGICAGNCANGNFSADNSGIFAYAGSGAASTKGKTDELEPFCDFWADHPFYSPLAADSAARRTQYPNKEILIPSSCLVTASDGALIATRLAATMGLTTNNSWCRGTALFATFDGGGGNWGMFDLNGTPRTNITNVFTSNLPAVVAPAHPVRFFPGNPRLNQHIRWGY